MVVYAIVVTYNGAKWIDRCFGSLIASTIPLKILAIDNASIDGTPELIKSKFPEVEVIETGLNLGFGKANNIGLKRALDDNADFAFLLNQDAWIENNTIQELISISLQHSDYGIISPIQLNGTGLNIDNSFSNYISNQNTPNLISDLFLRKLNDIYESDFANAAAWMITNKCLLNVGGFDPIYPHYGEDNDYVLRCQFKGFKLGIAPKTIIFHDRTIKETDINSLFNINKAENSIKLRYKNPFNPIPKKHFLIRKLILNSIINFFSTFYKDKNLHAENKRILLTIKLLKKIKKQREIESVSTTPHL